MAPSPRPHIRLHAGIAPKPQLSVAHPPKKNHYQPKSQVTEKEEHQGTHSPQDGIETLATVDHKHTTHLQSEITTVLDKIDGTPFHMAEKRLLLPLPPFQCCSYVVKNFDIHVDLQH